MANITKASNLLQQSYTAFSNGQLFEAASLAIAAQREAKQCRSMSRDDVSLRAHNIISSCLMRATEHLDRCRIGNILAESRFLCRVFL